MITRCYCDMIVIYNAAARLAQMVSKDSSLIFCGVFDHHVNLPACYCYVVCFVFTARKCKLQNLGKRYAVLSLIFRMLLLSQSWPEMRFK